MKRFQPRNSRRDNGDTPVTPVTPSFHSISLGQFENAYVNGVVNESNKTVILPPRFRPEYEDVNPVYHYNVNNTLFLTDYLLRKFAQVGSWSRNQVPEPETYDENQTRAIKMTNELQNIIINLLKEQKQKPDLVNFNPVEVQKQILSLLNAENYNQIHELIVKLIKENVQLVDNLKLEIVIRAGKIPMDIEI